MLSIGHSSWLLTFAIFANLVIQSNPQPPHAYPHGGHGHGQGPPPPNCNGVDDPRCVCNMMATLDYMNEMASVPYVELKRDPEIVPRRISSYQCVRPSILPATLRIAWNPEETETSQNYHSRPRRRMRVRRNLALGWDQESDIVLPKSSLPRHRTKRQIPLGYPSNELFYQILPKLETKSNHAYIPLGGRATLHCGIGPHSQNVIEAGGGGHGSSDYRKFYKWSHSDGRLVHGPEVSMDPRNGDLAFQSVSLSDSDLYSCNISHISAHPPQHSPGDEEGGQDSPPSEIHYQQLDVVAEPVQWLRLEVQYYTLHCSKDELTLINSHIVGWVHNHICFFCPVRNHSVSCTTSDEDGDEDGDSQLTSPDHKKVLLRLAVSTLGLERKMMAFSGYSEACPLPCIELLHVKILQIVRDSLEKLFKLNIEVESPEEGSDFSVYIPGSIEDDLVMACPSGFFADHKLCFPCSPGHFSPNGNSECFLCGVGSYQPTPGSGMCLPCSEGYSTIEEGAVGEFECKLDLVAGAMAGRYWAKYYPWSLYSAVVLGVLAVILLLACIIPCLCPKTWMGRCCAGVSCCGPDPDFDENVKSGGKGHGHGRRKSYEKLEYSDDDEDNERVRTRKIVQGVEETEESETGEEALNEVRILPAQVLVDDENRVVEVDVVGEVDARRTRDIVIKDHFLYQNPVSGGVRGREVQNYMTTTTTTKDNGDHYKIPLKKVGAGSNKAKIPKPPPLPATSYWASAPKSVKVQESTPVPKPKRFGRPLAPVPESSPRWRNNDLDLEDEDNKYSRNLESYKVVQHISTTQPNPRMESFPKLRHVEMEPTPEDRKSKNVYIFSTDDDELQSQTRPGRHSVKEFTRKLEQNPQQGRKLVSNSKSKLREDQTDYRSKKTKKSVNFHPIPKTRLIPSRAAQNASSSEEEEPSYIVAQVDHDRGDGPRALSRPLNFQKVGHASIRPSPNPVSMSEHHQSHRMELVHSKSNLRSPTSSEFDINAPINVRKIANRLEKRHRFSAGMLEDLTTQGKIPPGAFTYTPPPPMEPKRTRRDY